MKIQSAGIIALLATGAASADDYCKFERMIERSLPADEALTIEAGAGSLRITGDSSTNTISVRGRACASSQRLLDDIELRLDPGRVAELETLLPETSSWFNGRRYASLSLELVVPQALALDIADGSGSIELTDVGSTDMNDGSGSVDIRGVFGDLLLNDGSGSITIRDVEGNVMIDSDGSGSITIVDVRDDVGIGSDGSGSISIRQVGGDVNIGNDGSGSINVNQIAGNFKVRSDGSGSIDFSQVDGELDLPRDKYRQRK